LYRRYGSLVMPEPAVQRSKFGVMAGAVQRGEERVTKPQG
jgi:hypothetical protein